MNLSQKQFFPKLIAIGFLLSANPSFCQESKKPADQIKSPPPNTSDSKNLQESINEIARKKYDSLPGNLPPSDVDPKAKELLALGNELFFEKNQLKEGIEKIEAAIKIDPRLPEAYSTLSSYYASRKSDLSTAVRFLEDGVKQCPKSGSVRFAFGNLYSQMNKPKEAIEQFSAAMDLGIESRAAAFYNIGNAYNKLNKRADAIVNWKKALEEDEKHFSARKNLVIAHVQAGNNSAARKEAERLVQLDPNGEQGRWAKEALLRIGE